MTSGHTSGRSSRETNALAGSEPVEVFPYSVFYVFYEQYLTIASDTMFSVLVSVVTVFLVMLVFSGFDLYSSLIVAIGILLLVIHMIGCMFWFGVTLNAVSLVNIIMVSAALQWVFVSS